MQEQKENSADGIFFNNICYKTPNDQFKVNGHNQFCMTEHPPEAEVPIEPPSATTTTTIGISATSATFTTAFGKKRASVATTPGTNRKNKKNKTKDSSPSEPIILQDPQVTFVFLCIIMSFCGANH